MIRDILYSIALHIDDPGTFRNFALGKKFHFIFNFVPRKILIFFLASKTTGSACSLLQTLKKEEFKVFKVGCYGEGGNMVGGHFVLPNQHRYIENVVIVDGSFITIYETHNLSDYYNTPGVHDKIVEKIYDPILANRILDAFICERREDDNK